MHIETAYRKRTFLGCLHIALTTLVLISSATAAGSCQGTYAATPLQPLPAQIVVGLDIHDRSPRNLRLAERFLAGVREVGVATGEQPNVLLHVSTSRLGDTSSQSSRGSETSHPELFGLRSPPGQQLLFMRVDATAGETTRTSWVASVQCQMVGSDEGQLAQDLGRVIGRALGQRIERRPL